MNHIKVEGRSVFIIYKPTNVPRLHKVVILNGYDFEIVCYCSCYCYGNIRAQIQTLIKLLEKEKKEN